MNPDAIHPAVEFDAELIARLNRMGPRYTSYPTADRFVPGFGAADYRAAASACAGGTAARALSLYVHIPFCESLCYYCACNKLITNDHGKAVKYLGYLQREIAIQGRLFEGRNKLSQLHFGGGTPTYLSDEQMDELLASLRRWFDFAPDGEGEYSIEVDPRTVSPKRVAVLRRQGFNRLSLGVQDFDHEVQRAVNRIQPEAMTTDLIKAARANGFHSVSIDLIYGLPKQTLATIASTLEKVIAADPDRIAVYNYAHMPNLFKSQRLIADADLPAPEVKLAMLGLCIERLCAAGYVYIGMDHFAKPGDDLALAQRQGRLQRNFQGYSTHAEAEMVALGVSAISAVGGTYSQNEKNLTAWYARLDRDELPVARGVVLDEDDLLRRALIGQLMCNFTLPYASLALPGGGSFVAYFAPELEKLRTLERDGLVTIGEHALEVTPRGRLLIRNVCMVFDRYLGTPADPAAAQTQSQPLRFSRTI
ncbi:oxygen-independent coproporphyrinogen III oxidase [Massilia glaciei]|uniref:Coproporphyrinogen-III oxidase n=1 Tax=Massilia glaciei TaxID=1524097 RepID=A0A2U2HI98_9BURK|nr:oxygen-independent coproporphyrinogen III oxidase [Massilia glaciei]PWF46062.1 oxygen-independent coproporphyrinogen III oxidase [Massilia glaciei]